RFVGLSDNGTDGPLDSVRFVSNAPLMGGAALPGDLKEVRYEVVGGEASEMALSMDEEDEADQLQLMAVETPLLGANVQELEEESGEFSPDPNYEAPNWTVPIRTFDVRYFDGAEWVEEWDSMLTGRMPWCVQVRINFAKPDEQLELEQEERYDLIEDPDFEMVIAIPAGLGATQDARLLEEEAAVLDAAELAANSTSSTQSNAEGGDPK
ncbi:MAG: hypothetical protein JXR94_05775, partial [Candidatus Hydrogenedentes bacterium]|nr:hypothetical protein [Candidatus Hydrogenedentota bacterium]